MASKESESELKRIGDATQLVELAQAGDREAFRRVYEQHAGMVHGVLISYVRPQDAQDLVQDVFLKALQGIGTLRDPSRIGGWLGTIARNLARDRLRAARPAEKLPLDIEDRSRGDEMAAREILERLQSLPEAYRETLALRLVEGMTGREIADRTGLTEGSVRVNLTRGMKLLRESLARGGLL
ncbi:MAG: sigma-70 family RNA polymerase sigma factor [Planctomycetota bacterium]|nr:sigma-70 family RNA polymerase sigma factor [Planctomycetota bacterium]